MRQSAFTADFTFKAIIYLLYGNYLAMRQVTVHFPHTFPFPMAERKMKQYFNDADATS